ncbi:MAG: TonB-dependent receptor [Methylococcales bacterium]|nr:TonB-dependent receptor [Methylococcales bacterium]
MVSILALSALVRVEAADAMPDGQEQTNDGEAQQTKTAKPANAKESPEPYAAHAVDAFELPEVDVVSTTPVGTTGLALKKISGNVQSAEDEEINRHESLSLPDFMNRRMESVNINDNQNNPYQPDVTYRGFTASPLLGTPIGISVYQDGVRVNEPFGDTVNWDLIPQIAVANMEMMPGSNPLFGLNTLGGALSVRTKSGFSHPGFHAQAYGGSYGRQAYQAEYGGSSGKFDWYFAGNVFQDAGWRPYSPTGVNQGFGKVGWENAKTDLDLSFTFADNNMQGVGPTPQNMLQQNWSSIFTAPDITRNTLYFFNLKGSHLLTDELQISGNAYNRNNATYNLNSNTNGQCQVYLNGNECLDGSTPANVLTPGVFQASWGKQNGTGVNLQLTSDYKIAGHENQFVTGGGFNYGKTDYSVASQNAVINANLYELASSPLTTSVMITGQNAYSNVFATDTFSVYSWLHVNGSLNWLQAQVKTVDALNPVGSVNSLNDNSHYQRLNPAIGVTFNPLDALELDTPLKDFTTYFNYNEGFRAPTAVENSCANPNAPCSLPSSMTSDPPLKAVVSHTFETGMRGNFSQALKWNFAVYQTRNTNDILFVNCPVNNPLCTMNSGYFQNVGATLRQGLELGLNGVMLESLNWYVSYGFVDATYQSSAMLTNGIGSETVTPGNRIPSIPQNTLKFGAEYEIFPDFFLGSDVQYVSSQYARGDDQNIYPQIPAYTLLNLNSRYVLTKNVELFAMGRNVLDNHYLSYGQMGQNFYQNINQPTQYQGPGAVATGYAGIRVHWDL